jgi:peroxiredoxin
MKYKAGDIFPQLTVITSKGESLTIPVDGARYTHVQFRRFSGCPICNTHIAALRRGKPELDSLGIHEVLFFHSSNEDVAGFHHDLPFDAVGDPKKQFYRQFGVESSWSALSLSAISAAFSSLLRGKFALKMTGGPLGLPAEFLVGPDGRIKAALYGKDAYDQWTLNTVVELATNMSPGALVAGSGLRDRGSTLEDTKTEKDEHEAKPSGSPGSVNLTSEEMAPGVLATMRDDVFASEKNWASGQS